MWLQKGLPNFGNPVLNGLGQEIADLVKSCKRKRKAAQRIEDKRRAEHSRAEQRREEQRIERKERKGRARK